MTSAPTQAWPLTVPDVADRLGVRLDWLRAKLLKNAAAALLFVRVGPHRAIDSSRLNDLRAALGLPAELAATE